MERIDLDEGPQREEVMLEWKQAVKWWEKRLQLKGRLTKGIITHHVV